jgi:hypothetical protein
MSTLTGIVKEMVRSFMWSQPKPEGSGTSPARTEDGHALTKPVHEGATGTHAGNPLLAQALMNELRAAGKKPNDTKSSDDSSGDSGSRRKRRRRRGRGADGRTDDRVAALAKELAFLRQELQRTTGAGSSGGSTGSPLGPLAKPASPDQEVTPALDSAFRLWLGLNSKGPLDGPTAWKDWAPALAARRSLEFWREQIDATDGCTAAETATKVEMLAALWTCWYGTHRGPATPPLPTS